MNARRIGIVLVTLVILLVPAILWSGARQGEPVTPAATPGREAAVAAARDPDQEPEAAPAPLLYMIANYGSGLAVVDAASGRVKQTLGGTVVAPDGARLYTVDHRTGETRLRAVDPGTGEVAGETSIAGIYDLPWLGSVRGGLSANGRWLAVQSLPDGGGGSNATSRFAVVDTGFARPPRTVELPGYFEYDALSDDGDSLYLVEYGGTGPSLDRYQVRRYDLGAGVLDEAVVVDKRNPAERMTGFRVAALPSRDGEWLYSLYVNPENGARFVHALNVAEGVAVCIDLDDHGSPRDDAFEWWGLALSPGGESLYVVNGASRRAFEIDTAALVVRRGVRLPGSESDSGRFLERLARHLLPVARAKGAVANALALTPDGKTLLALNLEGFLVVDVASLQVRAHYLPDRRLKSLVLNDDGTQLYALTQEPIDLLRVDPTTGEILATLDANPGWGGLLGVWDGGAGPAQAPAATCPVTRPPDPPLVPPAPYPPAAAGDAAWYGSPALWTEVRPDGTWADLPDDGGSYIQKTVWWREGYDMQTEPQPDLVVTGRRLDGEAPPLTALRATNAFHGDVGEFMLVGIEIPTAGCWEITGQYRGQTLSYVVRVEP